MIPKGARIITKRKVTARARYRALRRALSKDDLRWSREEKVAAVIALFSDHP
jgi:hypothetical protein